MAFRKSFKVAPGVRFNLSSRGGSVSMGPKGAKVNVSSRGTRATVTVPGTGLSWTKSKGWGGPAPSSAGDEIAQLSTLSDKSFREVDKGRAKLLSLQKRLGIAADTLHGGRGLTISKKATYLRKLLVEEQKATAIVEALSEHLDRVRAAYSRLDSLRLGWFSGSAKRRRQAALATIERHRRDLASMKSQAVKALEEISEAIGQMERETEE